MNIRLCEHYRLYGYCGLCVSGIRGRQSYQGHAGYRKSSNRRSSRVGKFANRAAAPANGATGNAGVDLGVMGPRWEALGEYLVLDRWDDGDPRRTSTLLLFCENGRWSVCLNDREAGRSAWASGETPEAALDALEDGLASGDANWRASRQQAPQNRRK